MTTIEKACQWAIDIANDNAHGYDQIHRQGPDYDCSSLVINAYEQAGVPIKEAGATYTGNMRVAFVKCGFKAIIYDTSIELKKGDVLLNEKHHTALYLGNGSIVQASINEKGKIVGGTPGDQTGREIAVGKFYEYNKGWQYVLRYEDKDDSDNIKEDPKVNIALTVLKMGSKGVEVKNLQILLYAKGFNCGTADGDFGPKTKAALLNYQRAKGLKEDAICGKCTWTSILAA